MAPPEKHAKKGGRKNSKIRIISTPQEDLHKIILLKDAWILGAVERLIENRDYTAIKKATEKSAGIIFDEIIKEKPRRWTTKKWAEITAKYVHAPAGAGVVFTGIDNKGLTGHYFKCSRPILSTKNHNAICTFHYMNWATLWKMAFPEGELIVEDTLFFGSPTCVFKFITHATDEDKKKATECIRMLATKKKAKYGTADLW